MSERRAQIHTAHGLPKTRRCELLDVARSTAYYRPERVSQADLELMRRIDEIHLQWPFYGSRRIRDELQARGHPVNRKQVRRLMRQMDLRALRNGPQSLGSGKSEISRRFQAARSRVACSKYTASGVRPSSAL